MNNLHIANQKSGLKAGTAPKNESVPCPSVGQLDKTRCPTVKPAPTNDLTVGRHTGGFSRAREKTGSESLSRHIMQTMQLGRLGKSRKRPPKSKLALKNVEDIRTICKCFRKISRKQNVYLTHRQYLLAIKEEYLPIQYTLFIELAKSHALLCQNHREQHAEGGIYTSEQDFIFALRVMRYKAPKKRIKLLYCGRNAVLGHIKQHYPNRAFTVRMLITDTDYSRPYLKEIVRQLAREGIIRGDQEKRGTYTRYFLVDSQAIAITP